MRPPRFYAIFDLGRVTAVIKGSRAARAASPHRGYKSFAQELEAEEFAAWWNFTKDSLAARSTATLHNEPWQSHSATINGIPLFRGGTAAGPPHTPPAPLPPPRGSRGEQRGLTPPGPKPALPPATTTLRRVVLRTVAEIARIPTV